MRLQRRVGRWTGIVGFGLLAILLVSGDVWAGAEQEGRRPLFWWLKSRRPAAGEEGNSGSTRPAVKSYERHVVGGEGRRRATTRWTTDKGQGELDTQGEWDKEAGKGNYSGSLSLPDGRTASKGATVTRNAEGSYEVEGARKRLDGQSSTFQRTITPTGEGQYSVKGVTTTDKGTTIKYTGTVKREGGVRQAGGDSKP